MKKIFISIMMLLPAMATTQAQNVLTPEQQLEKAEKELEQAKKALEEAKARAKTEKVKAEIEKVKAETEKVKAEAEKANAEAEKAAKAEEADTETTSGWTAPVAVPAKKEPEKKVERNAEGAVLKADPKYLAGAITTNADGKVEFTLDTDASGKSAQQIYDIVFAYMGELTQQEGNIASRMALVNKNKEKGEYSVVNTMDEWLVFSQSFISLDRTEAKYNLVATITDNHLHLSIGRINYIYEEGRATGFKEPAESVITDKVALNKKKTALAKVYGKFRRLTIDRKDQIFSELAAKVRQ